MRQAIVTGLPSAERHRYFASMRSSQALAQSVFGSLTVLGKTSVLAGLTVDDGLPAVRSGVAVQMEYLVAHLAPRCRPGRNANYERDHCDGTYTRQRGRRARCSLTESRVRYWQYLPELFDWPADRNMKPCPLDGTYQLARNVLAACVRPDGTVDANGGSCSRHLR